MYSLIPLLAGVAAKLYDDLEDNNLLQKFRNNTLMEFLKGLHYIAFTATSIKEPMFFIIQYVANFVNQFVNKIAWSKPYEQSLLYSALLLFVIIDYKKITYFCLIEKLLTIIFILCLTLEPIVFLFESKDSEYSSSKMKVRGVMVIIYIILYYLSKSNTLKYITAYIIGYLFISVLVQYYSLKIEKLNIEKLNIEKLNIEEVKEEEKEVKEKEVKEKEEIKEIEEKEIEVKEEMKEMKEEVKKTKNRLKK
jgi:low affinity Fe/Cu permease